MELNIIARHFALTPAIADYVEKKLSSVVGKIHPSIIKAHVILTVEKKYRHSVEMVAYAPHGKFSSKSQTVDLYAAVDLAVDKLAKQLKKYKEKMKDHHRRPSAKALAPAAVSVFEDGTTEIAETKSFDIVEAEPSAAIEKMLDSGLNFFVFRNSETGKLSIVYKRDAGGCGMIDLNV